MLVFLGNLLKVVHDLIDLSDFAKNIGNLNSILIVMLRLLKWSRIIPGVFISSCLSWSRLSTIVYQVPFSITDLCNLLVSRELVRLVNAKRITGFSWNRFVSHRIILSLAWG